MRVVLTADSECHACGGSGVRGDVVRAELCVCVSAGPVSPAPALSSESVCTTHGPRCPGAWSDCTATPTTATTNTVTSPERDPIACKTCGGRGESLYTYQSRTGALHTFLAGPCPACGASAIPSAPSPTTSPVTSSERDAPFAPATMRTIAAADALADAVGWANNGRAPEDRVAEDELNAYLVARSR